MSPFSQIDFRPLYRVAQILSLLMLVLIVAQIAVFVIAPPPTTVLGFFELFRKTPFLGLLSMDFLYLINNAIVTVIYLALASLLFLERPVIVLLGLTSGLIGIACYYPSNPAFEMLSLSSRYFLAQPPQQALYLAAGEALFAGYSGTSFDIYYVLSTICLLLFAQAMIKSPQFHQSIGLWGLTSGIFMIIPSSAGTLGMIFSLLSLIPWIVFVALLVIHFGKLVRPPHPLMVRADSALTE